MSQRFCPGGLKWLRRYFCVLVCYLQHILSFQLPPTAAGAHVTALFKLTEAAAGSSAAAAGAGPAGAPAVWAKQVYNAAHEHLRRCVALCWDLFAVLGLVALELLVNCMQDADTAAVCVPRHVFGLAGSSAPSEDVLVQMYAGCNTAATYVTCH